MFLFLYNTSVFFKKIFVSLCDKHVYNYDDGFAETKNY